MERLYTDVYGDQHPKVDVNCHHVFARCTVKGKGRYAREFINQRGLVLPMLKDVHVELHQEVPFPPVPSASLMHRINDITGYMRENNVYGRFIDIVETIDSLSRRCANSDHRVQCGRIAENLAQQAPFILAGQVQLQPLTSVV